MKKFQLVGVLLAFVLFAMPTSGRGEAAKVVKLHRYTSLAAWNVNAFWIELENSIVLIDAQLLPQDAKMLASNIKSTGKPLAGVFITHPHPDHFAGLAVLKDTFGTFPIYASQETANHLAVALQQFLNSGFSKPFGDGVERRLVKVTNILKTNQAVTIEGQTFILDQLGAGESQDNCVIFMPQKNWLFTGDATMHHSHFYLGEGRSKNVLAQFQLIRQRYPEATLYSGHGEPARIGIVRELTDYVELVRALVGEAIQRSENLDDNKQQLTRHKRREIAEKIIKHFPNWNDFGFDPLQVAAMNIYGVEMELLKVKPQMGTNQ